MDRFIESVEQSAENVVDNLKSNMDRFIGLLTLSASYSDRKFKIQYGQIYSVPISSIRTKVSLFKIQYGQIYRVANAIGKLFGQEI